MNSEPSFVNPFRPGAGHRPPYLAGRQLEEAEFRRLLQQTTIMQNMILTGLRGVGKTVLLEHLKPVALQEIRRVLKDSGTLVLTDFGKPKVPFLHPLPWIGAVIEEGTENYAGKIPGMVREAGFSNVAVLARPRPDIDIVTGRAPPPAVPLLSVPVQGQ